MKLRARFIVWFALAALVPIAVAALVTREVLTRSYRDEFEANRLAAERAVKAERDRLETELTVAAAGLARRDSPIVGNLLLALTNRGGLSPEARRSLRDWTRPQMDMLRLDVFTIVGADDEIIEAPHFRGGIGTAMPEAKRLVAASRVIYRLDKVMTARSSVETVLVAETARRASDGGQSVIVVIGREIDRELIASVRQPGKVDTRVVDASGRVLVAPAEPKSWDQDARPARIALAGEHDEIAAWLEVIVWDRRLPSTLTNVTIIAGVLAVLALALTVLLGAIVARRITGGLDRLVTGAQAAARGDLDHRVPVTSKDEVGEVAGAFNLMMEDLRTAEERLVIAERIAAWQEIARRLAHEIKNPLTPIQMAMDNLRKTWRKQHPSFGEILEESTATVLEESDRLRRIVSEFSDFARMPKPDLAPLDLSDVVGGALALYQGETPVEHRLAAELPSVSADRGQMTQVVLNLVENARDAIAGRSDGKIVVTTRRGDAGDRVELVVEDNGPGVPADVRDKVFAPYFTTKHSKGGTGLGLAIVHRIVSDHAGRIVVGETAGGGARFAIELPLEVGQPLLASVVRRAPAP